MADTVGQSHLRVEPGFGQYYFHQVQEPDFLITSPNTSYLPTPPPSNEKINRHHYVRYYSYPRFIPDDMPHLAFLPRQVIYHGPIFGRLNVTYSGVPIVQIPNGYFMLNTDTINSWQRLETALFGIHDLLFLSQHTNMFGDLRVGEMPHECGYLQPHKTENAARYCAMKSRDAFLLLGALCSFTISFYRTGNLAKEIVPLWHKRLMLRSYTPQWLELLEETFVCNFSRGARVGGYLKAAFTRLFPQIRAFLDANVPIWLEWYLPKIAVSNLPFGSPFLPERHLTRSAIERAQANTHDPVYATESIKEWTVAEKPFFFQGGPEPYDEPFDNEPGEAGVVTGDYADPDDESDYGSKLDEDEDEDSILAHPPSCRAASQLRRSPSPTPPSPSSARQILPAPRPSVPAMWTEPATNFFAVHAGSGQAAGETWKDFFERRRVERTAAVRKETQAQLTVRYDQETMAKMGHKVNLRALFLWKLEEGSWVRTPVESKDIQQAWARFPPHLRKYDSSNKEWDICPFLEIADESPPVHDPPSKGSRPKGRISCDEDLAKAYDTSKTAVSTRLATSGLRRLLEGRYGFKAVEDYNFPQGYVDQEMVIRRYDQGHLARFRLHGRTTDDFKNDEAIRQMWNLILVSRRAEGLPHCFDISRQSNSPPSLAHEKLELGIAHAPGREGKICFMGIKAERLSKQYYLLAFKDFATVVQIYREGWNKGILQVGRELLQRGIPFNTVKPWMGKPATSERACLGLGHRPQGYVPNLVDYAHYEAQRSKLLRENDGLYAKVALKMGGLYWRLAMEDAGDDVKKLVKATLKHRVVPRPGVQVVGEVFTGELLVDDQLSAAAAAVLSGLYVVETSLPSQVEHVSWWPKQEVWYASELNVGYWSEACEDWYQKRLHAIRSQDARMLNATAWRDNIKGKGAHVTRFKTNFSLFAKDFIMAKGSPLVMV